ncbi:MAG: YceI family protein [Sphingobacteriales bacterium]|nr:MAG: YceI family protein [Sphingobacteriales bacterium]
MKKSVFALVALSLLVHACKKDKHDDLEFEIDSNKSVALWTGSTSQTSNNGSFAVNSTRLRIRNDQVIGGDFVIPIVSINNFNLPPQTKDLLLDHLKSADFFNMVVHPNASFELKSVKRYIGNGENAVSGANKFISGEFAMIGKTLPLSFPARIEFKNDSLYVEATFKIDRTNWGMNYASDPALGEHYINKFVDIHLKVAAARK